ncbi:ATP-binding protein [Paenibacillus koleovorans]|uniref:ATP-binding protein n=1 Tax=Paenibacillus koleovorans TaxID=121608 RepID=UPI000FD9EC7B|nr:ATP-binding protein [Paenibacillus koleovorans]
MFFTNNPENIFPGARIVIAQFGDDSGGDFIEEKTFRGPLYVQIRQALEYLNSFSTTMIRKLPGQAETLRTVAFPYEAMEEALVNAVFHRSYDGEHEPTKIMLYPNRMELTSYPGPMPGLHLEQFKEGNRVPRVPLRNRRIGEFLKELRLAEAWGTGVSKIRRRMRENGSPEPQFEFGDTYFTVILPAHPQYIVIHALRESAHLWAVGEKKQALEHVKAAVQRVPQSGALAARLIEYTSLIGEISEAEHYLQGFKHQEYGSTDGHLPYLAMARAYLDFQDSRKAASVLEQAKQPIRYDELIEFAVLHKRAGDLESAHRLFSDNFEFIREDPKAVHEFAETKMKLATQLRKRGGRASDIQTRLYKEAVELLRRVVFLSKDDMRTAWSYFHLAQALSRLRLPETEVTQAIEKAIAILPHENKFKEWIHNRKRD